MTPARVALLCVLGTALAAWALAPFVSELWGASRAGVTVVVDGGVQ